MFKDSVILSLSALCLLLCFACFHFIEPIEGGILLFMALMFGASLAYLLAVYRVRQGANPSLLFLFIVGILAYGIAMGAPSLFDDDLWRYTWDGKLLRHGLNPFSHPPNSLDVIDLWRKDQYKIPYDHVSTIYPPMTQLVFYGVSLIVVDSFLSMKIAFSLISFALAFVLLALLKQLDKPRAWVLIYLWNPLVIKEIGNSGHMDSWLMLWVLIALYALLKGRNLWGLIAWSFAVLSKFMPLIALPTLIVYLRRMRWYYGLIPPCLFLLAYLPFMAPEARLFGGLGTYGQYWIFNHGLYQGIEACVGWIAGPWLPTEMIPLAGRGLAAGMMGSLALLMAWFMLKNDKNNPVLAFYVSFAGVLAFAPTVDPWYLLWIAPFVAIYPTLSGLLALILPILSYGYYIAEADIMALRYIEYAMIYGALLYDLARDKQRIWRLFVKNG